MIWTEVLGLDTISVHDNLFSLGADSLHVFKIAARMVDRGIALDTRSLLRHPTVAELAAAAGEGTVDALDRSASLSKYRSGAMRKVKVQ